MNSSLAKAFYFSMFFYAKTYTLLGKNKRLLRLNGQRNNVRKEPGEWKLERHFSMQVCMLLSLSAL